MTKDISYFIDNEERLIPKKKYEEGQIKYVCAFPDYYEYGLPNIGHQTIYRECYSHENTIPDRYYLARDSFKRKDITWENTFCVKECDFLGFTISYEGSYINILRMLKDCQIPFRSINRDDTLPLIIAGGPTVMYNPLPLSNFFDAFILGEGEDVIHSILSVYQRMKGKGRYNILCALSEIKGIFVPFIHKFGDSIDQVPPVIYLISRLIAYL